MVFASLLNGYPRIGDRPDEQALRRAIARADRGEAAPREVEAAEDAMTRLAIAEQASAGLDIVTDGQIRWHDPVSHMARGLSGFATGGLLRYLDTNTYYRQPEARGPITRENPNLVASCLFASAAAAPRPVKVIVTGPLTMARLARDRRGLGVRALAYEIAAALNSELRDLAAAGAAFIQIDEPAIARFPGDLPILREAIPRLTEGLSGKGAVPDGTAPGGAPDAPGGPRTILATSFGDATPILPGLARLPVSIIGLDLLAARGAERGPAGARARGPLRARPRGGLRALAAGLERLPRDRGLLLGIVDGRNTRLEDPGETFERLVRPLLPALGGGGREIHLAPNHSLEFLPRETAHAKLSILAAVRDRAREALA